MGFFGKNSLFGKVSSKCAKFHSLILPIFLNFFIIFFFAKVISLKVLKKILGRRMQRCSQNLVEHVR